MAKRILVAEFITGGGLYSEPLPETLRHEGDAMLAALLVDIEMLGDWHVITTRDARLPPLASGVSVVPVTTNVDEVWQRCLKEVDAVWWIAPETDGQLERLNAMALCAGKQVIGCAPAAVALTANKLDLTRKLADCGLPVIPTWPLTAAPNPGASGWVVKPVDGAGCQHTYWCRDLQTYDELAQSLYGLEASFVVQACHAGVPASFSLLCANGRASVLACNKQLIEIENNRFSYVGSVVNAFPELCAGFAALADDLARAIPGLWGFVGVDVILMEHGPVIVEVNPRLTTSYVGLRQAIASNPAERILALPAADWWPDRRARRRTVPTQTLSPRLET
jgi:tyramine---L-glutamate ligase